MKPIRVIALLALIWLMLPTSASAHVGHSSSMAVDDRARITHVEPPAAPFEVRVIDGDQDLWLKLDQGNQLLVLGTIGEPFLRFNDAGVFANTHSSTAQTDLLGLIPSTKPSLNPKRTPSWFKVTGANGYLWHDHRIHALALLDDGGPPHRLGEWTIPLRLNGGRATITGELRSVSPPSRWFWLLLSCLITAGAIALLRWKHWRAVNIAGPTFAAVTFIAVLTARTGRDLYGRPDISTGRYLLLGIGLAVGGVVVERLIRGRLGTKLIVAMVVGVIGVVQGLTMLPAFWHGLVLVAIPAVVERICIALALGLGAASLVFSFAQTTSDLDAPPSDRVPENR